MVVGKLQVSKTVPELQAAGGLCFSQRITPINCASNVLEVMHLISRIAKRITPNTEIFISTTYKFLFIYQRPFIS
jgi:hypothetical protein